jgi:glycerol-3-phosphate cytidylyltransferase
MNIPASSSRGRVVLTYGTFDLFHIGHLNLLKRLKALGDYLIVAVSTDEFNRGKGKQTIIRFDDRIEIVRGCRYVDLAIPETCWEQKLDDVKMHGVHVFAMGNDWAGKFDFLKPYCEVVYLERTANISSTSIKDSLRIFSPDQIERMRSALGVPDPSLTHPAPVDRARAA